MFPRQGDKSVACAGYAMKGCAGTEGRHERGVVMVDRSRIPAFPLVTPESEAHRTAFGIAAVNHIVQAPETKAVHAVCRGKKDFGGGVHGPFN